MVSVPKYIAAIVLVFIAAAGTVAIIMIENDDNVLVQSDDDKCEGPNCENRYVTDCTPAGPDDIVPAIGIINQTHTFNLSTCVWDPNVTMQFSYFADNFSTCSSATFKHTMITTKGYPIYVIANITDDCKIHVTHDNREDKNTDADKRRLIVAECDKLKLEEDFIEFKSCIMSENEHGSFRVWK